MEKQGTLEHNTITFYKDYLGKCKKENYKKIMR